MKTSITQNKREVPAALRKLFAALFWLAVWQAAYLAVRQEILIVSPVRVLCRLWELAGTAGFWMNTASSMVHILEGFLLGVAGGCVLALFTVRFRFLYDLFHPILSIIKATPVASFIILVLVWFQSGFVPVFTSFLMVLPVIWGNVSEGIGKTDVALLEMARCFCLGRWKTLKRVYIPSVMPYFMAACTTSLGLAWKAGIAAEVLAHSKYSIGGEIYNSKIYLETQDLFAWTAVVIAMSVLLEKLMLALMRRAGRKYNIGSD